MYRLTYRGPEGYYGKVPYTPIFNSYDVALTFLLEFDQPDLPPWIETLYVEHLACGETVNHCCCDNQPEREWEPDEFLI